MDAPSESDQALAAVARLLRQRVDLRRLAENLLEVLIDPANTAVPIGHFPETWATFGQELVSILSRP